MPVHCLRRGPWASVGVRPGSVQWEIMGILLSPPFLPPLLEPFCLGETCLLIYLKMFGFPCLMGLSSDLLNR